MRILIIEDQEKIANAISYVLKSHKYEVDVINDGELGYEYALLNNHDLIILDIMLPGMDGYTILENIKRKKIETPVIILSAKSEVEDKVHGLDLGAEDYLPKPFAMEELISRINVIMRRKSNDDILPDFYLNKDALSLIYKDDKVELSLKEYQVFELLLRNEGKIISKEMFIDRIWGIDDEVEDSIIEVYISFLRKKIKILDLPLKIQTIRNLGYKLERVKADV